MVLALLHVGLATMTTAGNVLYAVSYLPKPIVFFTPVLGLQVELPDDAIQALLAEEATAYCAEELVRERQTWSGHEPALQLLCLPSSERLPSYGERPEYLSPKHCRLCLQEVEDDDMQQHLQACHDGISISAYRHRVLRSSLTEWPQPVFPQLLRTRVAAFKMEMSDANYKLVVCACCALEKRRFEVTRVSIPPPSASEAPAWLGYSTHDWLR